MLRGVRQRWGSSPLQQRGLPLLVPLSLSPCVPSPGSGATCLTHCDGSDTEAEVSLIMSSVKSFSNSSACGRSALLPSCVLLLSKVAAAPAVGSCEVIHWGSHKGTVQEMPLDQQLHAKLKLLP